VETFMGIGTLRIRRFGLIFGLSMFLDSSNMVEFFNFDLHDLKRRKSSSV